MINMVSGHSGFNMVSSPGHSGFNMVSVWLSGSFSPVLVGRGGIVGLSEKSRYLDYQKKKNND